MGHRHAGRRINAHAAAQVRAPASHQICRNLICHMFPAAACAWTGGAVDGVNDQSREGGDRILSDDLGDSDQPRGYCRLLFEVAVAARAPRAPSSDMDLHLMLGKHERWGLLISFQLKSGEGMKQSHSCLVSFPILKKTLMSRWKSHPPGFMSRHLIQHSDMAEGL